mgnify:CR=1 FL=1
MERWPNQVRAVEQTVAAIDAGIKRMVVASPTGSGKTSLAREIRERSRRRSKPLTRILRVKFRMLIDHLTITSDLANGKREHAMSTIGDGCIGGA